MALQATQVTHPRPCVTARTILRSHTRLEWLADGDANTEYFHSHARFQKRKNYIAKLQVGDNIATTHEQKEEAVWEHYNALLGTPEHRLETLNLEYFYQLAHELSGLDAPISEQEVWEVVKNMALDKGARAGRLHRALLQIVLGDN